jgi:hypothetical protein
MHGSNASLSDAAGLSLGVSRIHFQKNCASGNLNGNLRSDVFREMLWQMASLSIDLRIDRAQRLLRMIEQDAPLLAIRTAQLSRECQEEAKSHAQYLAALTRAELQRLAEEKSLSSLYEPSPQGSD